MDAQSNIQSRLTYSINESASLLGVSRRTMYSLIERGDLRPVRIGARQRVPAEQLARLVQPQGCAA